MPIRKHSSDPALSPTLDPAAHNILEDLNLIDSAPDCATRAHKLEVLGNSYRTLNMYGRSIQMYEQSLSAARTEGVCDKLAECYIHLLGEDGFGKARTLVKGLPSEFVIEKSIERKQAAIARRQRKTRLVEQCPALVDIVGESQHIAEVCEQILRCAATISSVLITGPIGSGKGLVAKVLHACSPRTRQPFVPVNCSSIPESLFESELFGHRKGAFTGANADRQGFLDAANGGTLFLDEISKLPLLLQGKILGVLDDKQFFRLGDSRRRSVDVRVLAATNQDLGQIVRAGQFLEDLLDRITGATIALHPLEDRLEDLPLLVKHFVTKHQLHPNDGQFSEYDIFNWLEADYLSYQQLHKATQWSVRHLEKAVQQAPYAPISAPVPSARVQGLDKAIQHAHAGLKLQRRGDYPVMERLTAHVNNEDKEGIGATYYTPQQLDDYDCTIACHLCPKGKDAAKLLGISESTVSRARRRLGL